MMDRQVSQVARLIDDLLDINRLSRGKIELHPESLDLADVVNQAVEAAHAAYEHMNHELTVTLPSKPIRLSGDPARLVQVIGNLLNNACKFTDRGGRVRVIVERDGDRAVVRIADNGIGIATANFGRIFEMFTQLDTALDRPRGGGLGIGLTLVKDLAEMHGGSIEVHSEGQGREASLSCACQPWPTCRSSRNRYLCKPQPRSSTGSWSSMTTSTSPIPCQHSCN